jgi:hypothetical protein
MNNKTIKKIKTTVKKKKKTQWGLRIQLSSREGKTPGMTPPSATYKKKKR